MQESVFEVAYDKSKEQYSKKERQRVTTHIEKIESGKIRTSLINSWSADSIGLINTLGAFLFGIFGSWLNVKGITHFDNDIIFFAYFAGGGIFIYLLLSIIKPINKKQAKYLRKNLESYVEYGFMDKEADDEVISAFKNEHGSQELVEIFILNNGKKPSNVQLIEKHVKISKPKDENLESLYRNCIEIVDTY